MKVHSEIDCKQYDCPYYGHYEGNSDDEFYKNLGLNVLLVDKKEIDYIIRATCNLCIFNPTERVDMKSFVIKQIAKNLLNK